MNRKHAVPSPPMILRPSNCPPRHVGRFRMSRSRPTARRPGVD
ncbi:hypothetical protein [Tessaracoccus sp. OH4464_COT-324]|nr:hypothetical protein [Tessaracoccus sp. OH4464_COT-324]